MDGADRDLFERSVGHAVATVTGAALDDALMSMGFADALAAAPGPAVSILFERQGASGATSSALSMLVAVALELDVGTATGVVLPALGGWDPPGTVDGGHVAVHGVGPSSLLHDDSALIVTGGAGTGAAIAVPVAELNLRPAGGFDPDSGWVDVSGVAVVEDRVRAVPAAGWSRAVRLARLAVGHELVGVARTMLELARAHAVERVQFGQTISTFQAVRHRLADTLVAIEAADALLHDAWDDGSDETAAMARAVAGRGARTAARHCQQVLAGIGFTTEHPFHRYVRRALVLDELFGSTLTLTRNLGVEVLARRQLPSPVPL
jgi:hypothetical protein